MPIKSASIRRLDEWMSQIRPVDALLPISITLHTIKDKSPREISLGLLVIWLAWRLLIPLLKDKHSEALRSKLLPQLALFLGLLLVNARVIIQRDDIRGPTQFLLIALGVMVGSLLSERAWKPTLAWISLANLGILTLFLHEATSAELPLVFGSIKTIFSTTLDGHQGINRVATLLMILTMASWYSYLLNRDFIIKGLGLIGTVSGYLLCIGSGSRMATVAFPLSALLAWLVMRLKGRSKKFFAISLTITAGMVSLIGLWWFMIGPRSTINLGSDSHRLEAARCWLSAMFTGHNRFLYGVGFNNEKLNLICHHIPNFKGSLGSIGHAHNTFAQIGGHHGLLGIIALLILLILVVQGLLRQQASVQRVLPLGPKGTTFVEMALGLNLALAFNALATTIHHRNQFNQVLIGLLAATALCAIRPAATKSVNDSPESPA